LSFVTSGALAGADDELQDKGPCNLFNPAPKRLLPEFVTDRPDKTEAPATVDAFHFQFEK